MHRVRPESRLVVLEPKHQCVGCRRDARTETSHQRTAPPLLDLDCNDVVGLPRELQSANTILLEAWEREHETSLALQRAMPPAIIPEGARGRVATGYLPAGGSLRVGGDWHDVELPSGRLAVAVGGSWATATERCARRRALAPRREA